MRQELNVEPDGVTSAADRRCARAGHPIEQDGVCACGAAADPRLDPDRDLPWLPGRGPG